MNLGAGDFLCYHKNAIAFIRQFYFLPRFVTRVFGQQYTFLLILMRKKIIKINPGLPCKLVPHKEPFEKNFKCCSAPGFAESCDVCPGSPVMFSRWHFPEDGIHLP